MPGKDEKRKGNQQPPSARQWAEARDKSPDEVEGEGREAGSVKRKGGPKDVASHSKADGDPGERPRDKKGLGRT